MIEGLREQFPGVPIGYSDHTVPDESMTTLLVAAMLGAVVLEKHFTHDKSLPGNDHYHAMDVADLRRLNVMLDRAFELLGNESAKQPAGTEGPAREHGRRSIVLAADLPGGAVLSESNLTTKRPAHGIAAANWDAVIGRRIRHALQDDHVLQWADLMPADQPD
jgi:N-acetylneuraminate synthase